MKKSKDDEKKIHAPKTRIEWLTTETMFSKGLFKLKPGDRGVIVRNQPHMDNIYVVKVNGKIFNAEEGKQFKVVKDMINIFTFIRKYVKS